jgi:hypothetical protein
MAQTTPDLRQGYSAIMVIHVAGQKIRRLDGFSGQA